jgi:hypothetical protein
LSPFLPFSAQDAKDAVEAATKQAEAQIARLKAELDVLRDELAGERSKGGRRVARKVATAPSSSSSGGYKHADDGGVGGGDADDEAGGRRFGLGAMPAATLPSGETSYAAAERIHQQMQQREEDARSLKTQLLVRGKNDDICSPCGC